MQYTENKKLSNTKLIKTGVKRKDSHPLSSTEWCFDISPWTVLGLRWNHGYTFHSFLKKFWNPDSVLRRLSSWRIGCASPVFLWCVTRLLLSKYCLKSGQCRMAEWIMFSRYHGYTFHSFLKKFWNPNSVPRRFSGWRIGCASPVLLWCVARLLLSKCLMNYAERRCLYLL
jgi:hypothetical protein